MSNEYYTATANVPPADTRSAPEIYTQAEFAKIALGFDKLPALGAGNRFSELWVNTDGDGLTLKEGSQEQVEPTEFGVGSTFTDAPTLHSFRLDPGGLYRVDGFIPHQTTDSGVLDSWLGLLLVFSQKVGDGYGIAISGSRNTDSTEFATWVYDPGLSPAPGGAALMQFSREPALTQTSAEIHGVIRVAASTSFLRAQFAKFGSSSAIILVNAGAWLKVTRLS